MFDFIKYFIVEFLACLLQPKFKVPTADEKQEYGGRSIVGCSSLIVVVLSICCGYLLL